MFEHEYFKLIKDILKFGKEVNARNGKTIKLNGPTIIFNTNQGIPIIQSRKYPYKGVLGEFAAFIRGPKKLEDFTKWGCNYWKKWANSDGSINLDYGNAWIDWNGTNQIERAIKDLKAGPGNRRVVITGWNPEHIDSLSLPCCHYSYQFIRDDNTLSLIWVQRSADVMVGLPADAILAWVFLTSMANTCGLEAGEVIMQLGDTHIYEEHLQAAKEQINRVVTTPVNGYNKCKNIFEFVPEDVVVDMNTYSPYPPIKYELKE